MPPQRATLLQVAQRAGVSRSTASFVLAGRHLDMRISEDARQRVLRAAQELDYRPNLMARSLRTKVTRTIALVSDTLASDPYAGRAIHGSLAAAVAHGHLLFIGETEGDPLIEEKLISDFLDRQVDAFVYASMFTRYVRIPKLLRGRPVVLLNCLTRAADNQQRALGVVDDVPLQRIIDQIGPRQSPTAHQPIRRAAHGRGRGRTHGINETTPVRRFPGRRQATSMALPTEARCRTGIGTRTTPGSCAGPSSNSTACQPS